MKKLILLLTVLFSLSSYAQKIRETIFEQKFGNLKVRQVRMTDTDSSSYLYLVLGYRNKAYQYITDNQIILLTKEDIQEFITDLINARDYAHNNKAVEWKKERYTLCYYDWSDDLFIDSEKKYTTINPKELIDLIEAVKLLKWER